MKKLQLPKWLKTGLPVLLGVLVVTAVVAYSANPAMFQGYLRLQPTTMTRIDPSTLKPAPIETVKIPELKQPIIEVEKPVIEVRQPLMPIVPIQPLPEKPTPLPLPIPETTDPVYPEPPAVCQQMKEWQASTTLTANINNNMGGDWSQWKECQDNYANYMNTWPTVFVCETYKSYLDAGTLNDMIANNQIAVADYLYCANRYNYMWHELTPPEDYCMQLRVFQEQGVLGQYVQDGIVPAYDRQICQSAYASLWNSSIPGEKECALYLEFWLQGDLTGFLNGNEERALTCPHYYSDSQPWWESKPFLSFCREMKQQETQGNLGNLLGNGTYAMQDYMACQHYFSSMWNGQNPDADFCRVLKGYSDQGILVAELDGDMTDADYCAANFPEIWNTQIEPEPQVACRGFVDVPTTHKYYDAVQYMVQEGIVIDNPHECRFRPNDNVNRSEASKLMVMGFKLPLVSGAAQIFPDVFVGEWYYDFISTVYKNGIMTGYPDGTFKPANTVVRSEMFKMFLEAYRGKKTAPAINLETARKACPDVMAEEVGRWYIPYVVEAKNTGLLPANDPCRSADYATRAEFAAMFYYVSQL